MSSLQRLASVAAVVAIAVVAFIAIGRFAGPASAPSPSPGPTATNRPSPTAEPTPTIGPTPPGTAFPSGVMPAGTYRSVAFQPTVVLTVPDGWTHRYQDQEGLVLTKGDLALYFTHSAAAVDAVGIGHLADASPQPVTLGPFAGLVAGPGAAGGTIFIDSGLRAWDSPIGSVFWAWVVDVGGRPLSIQLNGPPASVSSALPAVQAMLGTLGGTH